MKTTASKEGGQSPAGDGRGGRDTWGKVHTTSEKRKRMCRAKWQRPKDNSTSLVPRTCEFISFGKRVFAEGSQDEIILGYPVGH